MKIILPLLGAALVLVGCATAPTAGCAGLEPVESSAVKAVGYDANSQTLFVQLTSSDEVYAYEKVPADVYSEFLKAPSKGRFYIGKIKGQYESKK